MLRPLRRRWLRAYLRTKWLYRGLMHRLRRIWWLPMLLLLGPNVVLLVALGTHVADPLPVSDGNVRAGVPFIVRDTGTQNATLVCLSSKPGVILPPWLTEPIATAVVPASANNPPGGYGGAL